ncbi:MAG: sugar ABC transporter permease [Candidatus Borkfalkiaceae bacterium]|nr:sugar ABC transporter permease [Christensenellaceae bacterium]
MKNTAYMAKNTAGNTSTNVATGNGAGRTARETGLNTGAVNAGDGASTAAATATAAPVTPSGYRTNAAVKRGKTGGAKRNDRIGLAATYIALTLLSVLWLLPIVYLLYTAFRVQPDTGIINKLFPENLRLGWGNFRRLFEETAFLLWLRNTLIVATCSCLLTTLFILMVSYALSRLRFRLRKTIMNVLLVLGMFPGFMSMIAIYFILKAMGLTNSLFALILVYSGSAGLSYYICKGFFDTIPRAMEEAAFLDGAGQIAIFFKITLPLAKPIIVYTVLTSFIAPWCDFIFVNTIINDSRRYTLSLGLFKLINEEKSGFNNNFTVFCAGASVVGAIIVTLFMSMQRYYVEGVTGGAVKG